MGTSVLGPLAGRMPCDCCCDNRVVECWLKNEKETVDEITKTSAEGNMQTFSYHSDGLQELKYSFLFLSD